MNPYISVLMANYNNARFIEEAIESVLKQTYKNWELVIIDDCSTDDSVNVINKYTKDRRIILLQNKENLGYIETLQRSIDAASSEIIGTLDSDDAIAPTAIKEVVLAYKNNPECGLVYTQCYYCDAKLKPAHLGFSKPIPKGKSNLHINAVNAMRAFKKSAYKKTSGYNVKMKFAEDIDLNLKLEEVTGVCFINKPLYYYRVLKKSQTHGFRSTQINRSSTALAKLNAYKRRLGTDIANLNKIEISEVLFFGIISGTLAQRWSLVKRFIKEITVIYPVFFFDPRFYWLIFKKIGKIIKLKLNKPLLSIIR